MAHFKAVILAARMLQFTRDCLSYAKGYLRSSLKHQWRGRLYSRSS